MRSTPGERITIHGHEDHEFVVPKDTKPGQRLWIEHEGQAIDFTVVPLADVSMSLVQNAIHVQLTSRAARPETFTVAAHGASQTPRLEPGKPVALSFDLGAPAREGTETLTVNVSAADASQTLPRTLRTAQGIVPLAALSDHFSRGICVRKGKEQGDLGGTGAIVQPRKTRCGDVAKDALFMHPPYQGGVGYAFARYEPVLLPKNAPAAFRALVGKEDGSDPGDGILYKVAVVDESGAETILAQQTVTEHAWRPIEADLSRWAGQKVALKLIADVGTKDNSSGDWACWAEMRIESLQPVLHRTLE